LIETPTPLLSPARYAHSSRQDRQELPSVLVLFYFRVSSAPPRLCARHKHFSLARSFHSLKTLRRRGVQLNSYCTDTLLCRFRGRSVLLSGSSLASLRLCASMVLGMPCCSEWPKQLFRSQACLRGSSAGPITHTINSEEPYFGVDAAVIWRTVREDLPLLRESIARALSTLKMEQSDS